MVAKKKVNPVVSKKFVIGLCGGSALLAAYLIGSAKYIPQSALFVAVLITFVEGVFVWKELIHLLSVRQARIQVYLVVVAFCLLAMEKFGYFPPSFPLGIAFVLVPVFTWGRFTFIQINVGG